MKTNNTMQDHPILAAELPITNCHTHIFTGDHVPPYLARTFIPWPLYLLVPLSGFVSFFRWYYKTPYRWKFKRLARFRAQTMYAVRMFVIRHRLVGALMFLIGLWLTIQVLFISYGFLASIWPPKDSVVRLIENARAWLASVYMLYIPDAATGKWLLAAALLLFFKFGRNLVWFALKKVWSFLGILPGEHTKALISRYLNIGRFAFYGYQKNIYYALSGQYPKGTRFIILPMDMEYMDAGSLKTGHHYKDQMAELALIKKTRKDEFLPFVFADPRRFEDDPNHFVWSGTGGNVVLQDCFVKTYLEDYGFSGIKIYPALGYYPFDPLLLPLWKYAADRGIPIITHCIRGTIFYRGMKKKEWDKHPIFREGKDYLILDQIKNRDFINNFTHPLNYLCLLDETFLRRWIGKHPNLHGLFGYKNDATPLQHNLSNLKMCFGHYGGDDEWNRYLEMDRSNYGRRLAQSPDYGLDFSFDHNKPNNKMERIWKYADWYSIISSMMLQYPNVYADLSYIIHNDGICPLLKQTLKNPGLKGKVLFGTDFYVVRNHKSEKSMYAGIRANLTAEEFDQIARINPAAFI